MLSLLGISYLQENRGPETYVYLFCPSLRKSISYIDEQSTIPQFPNPKIFEKSFGIDLNWWKAIYSLHLIHLVKVFIIWAGKILICLILGFDYILHYGVGIM